MLKIIEQFLTIEGFSIIDNINIDFAKKPFDIFQKPEHRETITDILNDHENLNEYIDNLSHYGLRWLNVTINPINAFLRTSKFSIVQYNDNTYILLLANIDEVTDEISIKAKTYKNIQHIYQDITDDLELINSDYLITKFFNK